MVRIGPDNNAQPGALDRSSVGGGRALFGVLPLAYFFGFQLKEKIYADHDRARWLGHERIVLPLRRSL